MVTVPDLLAAKVAADPDAVAIAVDGGASLTYRAWSDRSAAIARSLIDRSLRPGDRVALVFEPEGWVEAAVTYIAVQRAGGVPVPLAPRFPRLDLLRILDHSRAAGVVCPAELVPPGAAGWVATPSELEAGVNPSNPSAVTAAVDPAAEVLYAAAPLRPPRAVAVYHAEVTAATSFPLLESGTLVHHLPLGTPAGQEVLRLPLHQAGHHLVFVAPGGFDPARFRSLVAERRARACAMAAWMARALVEAVAPGDRALSSVATVVVAGRLLPATRARLAALFPHAKVIDVPVLGPGPGPLVTSPATSFQAAMVWHEQLTPRCANRVAVIWRRQGPLDVDALRRALDSVVRSHADLRTTFTVAGGRLARAETPLRPVELGVVDLGHLDAAAQKAEVRVMVAELRGRPFDLSVGPLLEPALVRLGPDDHVLVARAHHSVCDDWSLPVFHRELSARYAATVAGHAISLEASRRRALTEAEEPDGTDREHWGRELAGATLTLRLPIVDPGRPPDKPVSGAQPVSSEVPADLAASLHALARKEGTTLGTVVLSALAVLAQRLTGQDEIVLSTLLANRDASRAKERIGCLAAEVPVRVRLGDDPTFVEVVAAVGRSLAGAAAHQGMGVEAVLDSALGPEASARDAVPHVAVSFQGVVPTVASPGLPGLGGGRRSFPASTCWVLPLLAGGDGLQGATFLGLTVTETQPGSSLALVAEGVFHPPVVHRLLADLQGILTALVAEPGKRVSALGAVLPVEGGPTPATGGAAATARVTRNQPETRTLESANLEAAWADALGVERVSVDDRYWQSFPFLEALSGLHQTGMPIHVRHVARNRTIRGLATSIAVTEAPVAAPADFIAGPSQASGGKEHRRPRGRWRVELRRQRATPAADSATSGSVTGGGGVIWTRGLTKRYPSAPGAEGDHLVAVDDLDLSVHKGEIFGLLGPNGAGKTTTVGMLTTRVVPTAGQAVVHGVDVVADPARAKRFIGVVPQANTLDRSLSVAENLWFHGRYFGMGAAEAKSATDEALERFRLTGRGRSEVHTLSGGMAQRLMVARAILHRPSVLFLDEPTAGLDPQSRLALWDIIAELHSAGQTILLTTHYMEEADRMCDRVAIMDHGRVLALDTPERLKHSLSGDGDAVNLETVFINLTGRELRE